MTRTGAPTRRVVAATMLLAFGVLAPTQTAFADDSEIVITRIDSSGYPTTTIEFSAPAGRTGGTLSTNSVTLREGGKSVPFQLEVVPSAGLEVVLLIDTSASMKEGDAMAAARAAAISFLAVLPIEVPVGVISFADSVSMSAPLTTDRALLAATISKLSAHGETAMYDAVNFARTLFSGASADRQFVLLSDGGDTVSRTSLADALGVSTEIRTNVIELSSSEANHNALLQLANANSGSLAAATDPAALNGAYMQVANSLVNRYRLVFQATSP
ncbi:MAG: VWA domain-containing protein, partial [Actinobacteria bacterium]|nr:VWA domain-containing protein [Actinomycetota bacterium]